MKGASYLVEKVLKLLVGQVDANLLETIGIKVFKSKDVKDSDLFVLAGLVGWCQQLIDLADNPAE